jgi:hypothetical protein
MNVKCLRMKPTQKERRIGDRQTQYWWHYLCILSPAVNEVLTLPTCSYFKTWISPYALSHSPSLTPKCTPKHLILKFKLILSHVHPKNSWLVKIYEHLNNWILFWFVWDGGLAMWPSQVWRLTGLDADLQFSCLSLPNARIIDVYYYAWYNWVLLLNIFLIIKFYSRACNY